MTKSGGHGGLIVHQAPREYEQTPQQKLFKEAAEHCGIKKGITKAELLDKMKNCIPEFYRQHKDVTK
ncbi:MAG: hypothetical protein PHI12_08485 [Dehalococcoidales bacterium]|nr:hypothetical protein [Dehalococcoidales bacterium]